MAAPEFPGNPKQPPRNFARNVVSGTLVFGVLGFVGAELAMGGMLAPILANPLTIKLPYYVARTLARMSIAYVLALAFALAYGITAALNHRASHVMLPLLDILQSVPVLAFLPIVFLFFLSRFPGSFGEEISSIILIFTAMVWAPTFGVIAGVNAIPQDIKEASQAYGMGGIQYLRQVVLPAVYPELVWTSILAWGGGWYLIPIEEYFTFGRCLAPPCPPHTLPGIGFYIADAANRSDLASSVFGVMVLVGIIVLIDRLVWRPLERRTDKYKYESVTSPTANAHHESRVVGSFRRAEGRLLTPIVSFLKYERAYLGSFLETAHLRPRLHISDRMRLHDRWAKHTLAGRVASIIIFAFLFFLAINLLSNGALSSVESGITIIQTEVGIPALFYDTGRSLLRILTSYTIALTWTLAAGMLIARSERVSKLLVPIFDIGQSIPATALFPIIILLLVRPNLGNPFALEIASVLLMLTGMQWYILFNIVGAIHNLPADIAEATAAYRIRGLRFAKEILVPASFPAIIIGSIQAWGGGWNATIVSEYISVSGQNGSPTVYQVPGLGSLLNRALSLDPTIGTVIIAATILTMTATIVIINRVVWRRLLKKADKYKFEA
ncbi:MAG: hypothetical protein AUJ07_00790 [Crenarchaeota archaeon 13_1_40CM_3_53_5]|nr:MAG: hypothetical protein AUJ07_00790 [Crenarchaeota archaeon 13_1_40CM_3_53_5]